MNLKFLFGLFLMAYKALNIISGISPKSAWKNMERAIELCFFKRINYKNSNTVYHFTFLKNLSQKWDTDLTIHYAIP